MIVVSCLLVGIKKGGPPLDEPPFEAFGQLTLPKYCQDV